MSYLLEQEDGLVLLLYVQPGAKSTELSGLHDGRIKIRLNAAPVDGKANKELLRFLSKELSISKSNIRFIRGEQSRQKDLKIKGFTKEALEDWISNHR